MGVMLGISTSRACAGGYLPGTFSEVYDLSLSIVHLLGYAVIETCCRSRPSRTRTCCSSRGTGAAMRFHGAGARPGDCLESVEWMRL